MDLGGGSNISDAEKWHKASLPMEILQFFGQMIYVARCYKQTRRQETFWYKHPQIGAEGPIDKLMSPSSPKNVSTAGH